MVMLCFGEKPYNVIIFGRLNNLTYLTKSNLMVGMVTIINLEVRLDMIGLAMISSNYREVPI